MDFYSHQAQALRRTSLLVVLFSLAVISLIVLLNLLLAWAFLLHDTHSASTSVWHSIPAQQWLLISALVVLVIGGASLFRWQQLRGGGKVVAQALGGELLMPDQRGFYERRLLNVVEEIALAAGVPVPPVYVLNDHHINAFAAGYRPSDAVIGVTRGAMEKLSRDQLQGVIAHEFSHIFNGDMRLNIRIMAVLFGLLFIGLIGRFLLDVGSSSSGRRRSSKDNSGLALLALGAALMLLGYSGVLFGTLIKAAVSRQREFLADASAVQFTRNPAGISGALKVIATEGSTLSGSASKEASHLFFGTVSAAGWMAGLMATHPPLDERIRRIEPRWDGQYLSAQSRSEAEREARQPATPLSALSAGFAGQPQSSMAPAVQSITSATLTTALDDVARQPDTAPVLALALLLTEQVPLRQQQLALAAQQLPTLALTLIASWQADLQSLAAGQQLPLLERAVPALKQLPAAQYPPFRQTLQAIMDLNPQPSLAEWCRFRLLTRYLDAHFRPVRQVQEKHYGEKRILNAAGLLLSAVARYGHDDEEAMRSALQAGATAGGFGALTLRTLSGPDALEPALQTMQRAYPHLKGRLLKALLVTAQHDGQLRPAEQDLVRTMAAVLEMPVSF